MIAKYDIEYTVFPEHNHKVSSHRTDDPVAAEEFLMSLLLCGARIHGIKHEGMELERTQQDRMLRTAAERLSTRLLSRSLHIDPIATKHRFGFAA
ncbi:hypothetical protein DES53_112163 [Roseimicrobium gellanilyticum]|uniref:Uncharacterized protein n=1 Tax=Roseimicrobium gellanilyticum TaxID=748857 RepID=A0A366H7Z5_9BACT|nr:hypothetical protein [Roseimicrobium gellanilyticum]RBP38165.1 hypothetical protein DES53_112163 [Roseimicrobium gellanilyticum]